MGRQNKKRIAFILAAVVMLLGACGRNAAQSGSAPKESAGTKTEFFGMNTYITFTVYDGPAEEALEKARARMTELEKKWSVTDTGSEIYQVNHSEGEPVTVSDETAELVACALDLAERTEGALEPTIYPVLTAWGFTTEENRVPDEEELSGLLDLVDYRRVKLNGNQVRVPEGMELDLGAVGKGYAGDLITELLKESGVTSAILDLGGNIQTIGSRPDGGNWRLGIRSPYGEGAVGVLSVSGDCAVVTSGNYERYFVGEDGKEYGHIIDPATGYPAENELASVTIITEEGRLADALSTSMLVKGLEGAEEYWRKYQDFEMIAITDDGEIYLTEGIEDRFSLSGSFAGMRLETIEA